MHLNEALLFNLVLITFNNDRFSVALDDDFTDVSKDILINTKYSCMWPESRPGVMLLVIFNKDPPTLVCERRESIHDSPATPVCPIYQVLPGIFAQQLSDSLLRSVKSVKNHSSPCTWSNLTFFNTVSMGFHLMGHHIEKKCEKVK